MGHLVSLYQSSNVSMHSLHYNNVREYREVVDIVASTAFSPGMAVMHGFADSAQSTRGKYASGTPV